jgi:hypothetical protein
VVSVETRSGAGADPRLVRAYRRLLRAYPPGPRREELLDTLVECAPPGRRRPALREVVNLTRHGCRARLGRPKSRGVVVLTLFLALTGGILGAAAANRLGWEAAPPLPDSAGIAGTVFPGLTTWGGGPAPAGIVSQSDGEGLEYGYAVTWVRHTAATRDVAAYTAGVRSRLEAAGWRVTSVDPPLDETDVVGANAADRSESFTATRGPLGLRFNDYYWAGRPAYDGDGNATFYLWQGPPTWLAAVTWLGFLPGALLAWLLTGWASRRLEPNPGMTGPAATGAVLAVLCVVPAALLAVSGDGRADETAGPTWQGLGFALTAPVVLFGLFAGLLLLIAAVQRPPRWRPALPRRPRRAIALAAVAALLTGAGVYSLVTGYLMPGSCTPSVPAGIVDPPEAREGGRARVYLSRQATVDQRNLAQAAIWRGLGGSQDFAGDPRAPGFTTPYCEHGRIDDDVAETLPQHWTVELASPGLFGGLANEMMATPGVVAVEHIS